jgi:hypothetical protein
MTPSQYTTQSKMRGEQTKREVVTTKRQIPVLSDQILSRSSSTSSSSSGDGFGGLKTSFMDGDNAIKQPYLQQQQQQQQQHQYSEKGRLLPPRRPPPNQAPPTTQLRQTHSYSLSVPIQSNRSRSVSVLLHQRTGSSPYIAYKSPLLDVLGNFELTLPRLDPIQESSTQSQARLRKPTVNSSRVRSRQIDWKAQLLSHWSDDSRGYSDEEEEEDSDEEEMTLRREVG